MPNYIRWRKPGGIFFFTLVTHERRRLFCDEAPRRHLREAIIEAKKRTPFLLDAMVLMPDHLHLLMRLPENESDYSIRLAKVKRNFTERYLSAGGAEGATTQSRRKHRDRGVWERRFYEHCIRDYPDWKLHLDYIHVNPLKHGLVTWPRDWPWSTFNDWMARGEYHKEWCGHITLPGGVDIEPDTW